MVTSTNREGWGVYLPNKDTNSNKNMRGSNYSLLYPNKGKQKKSKR